MVLFVFAVMLLNLSRQSIRTERTLLSGVSWTGPTILAGILTAEFIFLLGASPGQEPPEMIAPAEVGMALFGPYMLGIELASMLLLSGLVGAYHLGARRRGKSKED